MSLKVISTDSPLPVTGAELADWLRVDDYASESVLLDALALAALEWAESVCSCFFRQVTAEYTQAGFSSFLLPVNQPVSFSLSEYSVDGGLPVTLVAGDFTRKIFSAHVQYYFSVSGFPMGIYPDNARVKLRFQTEAIDVPETIKTAIKLKAGQMYASREASPIPYDNRLSGIADDLLWNYRTTFF